MKKIFGICLVILFVACNPGPAVSRVGSVEDQSVTGGPPVATSSPFRVAATVEMTGTPAFLNGIPVITATVTFMPTASSTIVPGTVFWLSVTQNVNCRKGPNTFYDVVKVLEAGQQVEILGHNGATKRWETIWWFVHAPGSAEACWVSGTAGQADENAQALSVMAFPALPDLPANFSVSAACPEKGATRKVKLSWMGPPGTTGYVLYRRVGYDEGKLLAHLAVDETSFKDEIRVDTFYTYELATTNEYGASRRVAAWAEECR